MINKEIIMNRKAHWEKIYTEKVATEVSWYQAQPKLSLELILKTDIQKDANIIDVGGGASVLVDHLLDHDFEHITVLDVSSAAIEQARSRLGHRASKVAWIEADALLFKPPHKFDVWHDRAVFHFLTEAADRRKYIKTLNDTLTSNGHLIISTFALEGPPKCSGLDVMRYNPETLSKELGNNFTLMESCDENHLTPWKMEQKFVYCRFKRID